MIKPPQQEEKVAQQMQEESDLPAPGKKQKKKKETKEERKERVKRLKALQKGKTDVEEIDQESVVENVTPEELAEIKYEFKNGKRLLLLW